MQKVFRYYKTIQRLLHKEVVMAWIWIGWQSNIFHSTVNTAVSNGGMKSFDQLIYNLWFLLKNDVGRGWKKRMGITGNSPTPDSTGIEHESVK